MPGFCFGKQKPGMATTLGLLKIVQGSWSISLFKVALDASFKDLSFSIGELHKAGFHASLLLFMFGFAVRVISMQRPLCLALLLRIYESEFDQAFIKPVSKQLAPNAKNMSFPSNQDKMLGLKGRMRCPRSSCRRPKLRKQTSRLGIGSTLKKC